MTYTSLLKKAPAPAKYHSLVDLLQQKSYSQSNRRAYTFLVDGESEEVHISYGELGRRARVIAAHLQSTVSTGDRALLLYPPGLEFIAAFMGCLYAGVVAVPAYPPRRNQKMSRLRSIVEDSHAEVVLTTTALLHTTEQKTSHIEGFENLRYVSTEILADELEEDWQHPNTQPESLAFLQYTSGSTGQPKGVTISHGNLLYNSEYIKQTFGITSESISVIWLPSFHDMGLIGGLIQPLYTGSLSVLMPPSAFVQKPIRWLQAISHYRATHCGGPNFGYQLCNQKITDQQKQSLDLSCWHTAYCGAEPIYWQTLETFVSKFASCGFQSQSFSPCYGLAEATLMVSASCVDTDPLYCSVTADALARNLIECDADIADKQIDTVQNVKQLVGCGQAQFETKVAIVDPETLMACSPGEIGEIWVASPSVAQGYWQQPLQTKETFQAHLSDTGEGPFLRTGDLGFLQGNEIFVSGRIKDLIVIRGRNHYPQDIEMSVSQSHPALRIGYSAAFSIEVDGAEQLVVTQEVERSHLRHIDIDEVTRAVRQAVAEQHDLSIYAVVLLRTASIPKTSSGKIQRFACRDKFLGGDLSIVGERILSTQLLSEATATDAVSGVVSDISQISIQDWLIGRIAQGIQIDPDEVDIEAPFTQYGLDSSVVMSWTEELSDFVGCKLEPTLFWEYPNIEDVAEHLEERRQR